MYILNVLLYLVFRTADLFHVQDISLFYRQAVNNMVKQNPKFNPKSRAKAFTVTQFSVVSAIEMFILLFVVHKVSSLVINRQSLYGKCNKEKHFAL